MHFKRYMRVERFGNTEVEGIDNGECYIFPKLDGTNASLWWDNKIKAGSRSRVLSLNNDNAGFLNWAIDQPKFKKFFRQYPHLRLYGEWLVPHSFKGYKDDAWREFYVFDVQEENNPDFIKYFDYKAIIEPFGISYIPAISILIDPLYDDLLNALKYSNFLIKDSLVRGVEKANGEGIVIKNYDYINDFGRITFAKIINESFHCNPKNKRKVKSNDEDQKDKADKKPIEQKFVDEIITMHLVNKVYAKIKNANNNSWNSRFIPRLLQTVYYDLIKEELWDFIKKNKSPTINFRILNTITVSKIKELKPELF